VVGAVACAGADVPHDVEDITGGHEGGELSSPGRPRRPRRCLRWSRR
jgi:hypothetical protein